jgi:hypothetical protein
MAKNCILSDGIDIENCILSGYTITHRNMLSLSEYER